MRCCPPCTTVPDPRLPRPLRSRARVPSPREVTRCGIRSLSHRAQDDDEGVPSPRARYDLALRSIMSAGEAVGETVFAGARAPGVTINEMFARPRSTTSWGTRTRSGRPSPARSAGRTPDTASPRRRRWRRSAAGENRRDRGQPHRRPRRSRCGVLPRLLEEREGHAREVHRRLCRTGDLAKRDEDGYFWYQGGPTTCSSAGYRIGPSEIENCLVKHPRSPMRRWCESRSRARQRRESVHRPDAGPPGLPGARGGDPQSRARTARAL